MSGFGYKFLAAIILKKITAKQVYNRLHVIFRPSLFITYFIEDLFQHTLVAC
jgi:hypothetical protein